MSSNSPSLHTAASQPLAIVLKPGSLALEVVSGIHHGVQAPIEGDACTIGSSPACDLVLGDRNVAAEHVQLRFYGKQVAVNAVGGTVLIEGRTEVMRGYGCRATLPITLTVGDAKLRIGRDDAGGRLVKSWRLYAGVVAVCIAITPIVAVRAGMSDLLPEVTASHSGQLTVGSIPALVPVQSDEEIIQSLRDRIAEAKLGELTLSSDGRRIDVSGQISTDRMDDWRDLQQWFDRSHGGRYVLTSLVAPAVVGAAPRFVFEAVFFGENPYVVDARGERRYPGAALQDGWMLKWIGDGQILVVRGKQEFKLTL